MRAIDRLAEHWLKVKGARRRKTIALRGGGEFVFWWDAWTNADQDFVYGGWKAESGFDPNRWARVALRKALNEDGSRMFENIELIELQTQVDPDVVKAIAIAITADLDEVNAIAAGGDAPKAGAAPATPS